MSGVRMKASGNWRRQGLRALVTLVVVGLAALATVAATDGSSGKLTISVTMADATPLRNGNTVRAAGVAVGSVQSVTLDPQDHALVTMTVDRDVLPLHSDATATLVPQDLLGERFVLLDPGTASAPTQSEPYRIDIDHSKNVVDLQNVVDMVDNPTGTSLAMMLTTLGEGIGKNPEQTRDAIAALKPAMEQTNELAQVLNEQNQLLSHLVATAQPVASAVAVNRGASLDHLVGSTTNLLRATADNRQQIDDSLRRLPATLVSARNALAHVAGVAPPTTETLKNLRPVTDDLVDLSHQLKRFSEAGDPALASLRPVLVKGKDMLDELRPVVQDLRDGTGDLETISRSYHRLADGALSNRLVDLMEFMKGWSLSTSDYDALSHYFRAVTPYTPKTLVQTGLGPIPGAPKNPIPTLPLPGEGRLPIPGGDAQGAPDEHPALPGLGTPAIQGHGKDDDDNNAATGLTRGQEDSMMNQFLGGR